MTVKDPEANVPGSILRASWPPVLLMLVLAASFLIGGHELSSQRYDQNLYHIQVIRQFEAQLPTPDFELRRSDRSGHHLLCGRGNRHRPGHRDPSLVLAGVCGAPAGRDRGRLHHGCSPRSAALLTAPCGLLLRA